MRNGFATQSFACPASLSDARAGRGPRLREAGPPGMPLKLPAGCASKRTLDKKPGN
jgi:hypothetical protein